MIGVMPVPAALILLAVLAWGAWLLAEYWKEANK